MPSSAAATPHYVTISNAQVRVWRAGSGPGLLVLPGLAAGAGVVVARLAKLCPGWSVTSIELPVPPRSLDDTARTIATAADALGLAGSLLVALDMAAALADRVARQVNPSGVVRVAEAAARAWSRRMPSPSFTPRHDGAHLTALFAHLRDLDILEPADSHRPAALGSRFLDPDEQHAGFVTWAAQPQAYAELWRQCAAELIARADALDDRCRTLEDLPAILAWTDRPPAPPVAATQPLAGLWTDYADIADGRVHLRRAGSGSGLPMLAFQSAPGSSAPLTPLIEALGTGREVIAPDYLGNGDSSKPARKVDIALLARDALQLADRLNLKRFDLWGTHTGALVALELALLAPERVNRAILEAPPLLAADFSQDILANYLPPLVPDKWGLHVQQAWNMRRDMFLFWPWYRQERGAVRPLGLPDAQTLHDWTVGLLKSGRTYDLSYRAAFEYDTWTRLPLIRCPALICAGPADMLADGLAAARRIVPPQVEVAPTPATVWYPNQSADGMAQTLQMYARFLSAP